MSRHPHTLILPGLDGTGLPLGPFAEAWSAHARTSVVAYPSDRFLEYDALADLVAGRMPPEGPVVLIAESFSGPVAARLAVAQPGRVAAVVLAGSFVARPWPWLPAAIAMPFCNGVTMRLGRDRSILRALLLNGHADPEAAARACEAVGSVPLDVLAARLRCALRAAWSAPVCSTVPMLYLRATRDRLVHDYAVREARRRFVHATVVPIDAPHMLLETAPAAAASAIAAFLDRVEHRGAVR